MLYTFSLPTKAAKVPVGSDWLHEVKYDGYRMMLIREQDRVRLISRGGHDWARRFPLIVTAALKLRQEHFVLDGETVVLGPDGVSDFAALHSGRHNERGQFYAFDMLAGDGEDQRQLPLSLRKTNLARLLKRRISGVFIAEYEQAKSAGTYSASPVVWASKASSRSAAIAPIPPGNAGTGSRRKTQRTRPIAGSGTNS
jgi:ATP-dependent DNA ligase